MLQRISESEMEVMQVIWEAAAPVTSAQIQAALGEKRQWKATTLLTFLARLCEKGILQAERQGKANAWSALISREEYRRMETMAFLKEVHHGSLKSFVAALNASELRPEELQELREWFQSQQ